MKEIAQELLKIRAVFLRPDEPFIWASGLKSPIYCDNRLVLSNVETRTKIEKAFVSLIKEKFDDVDYLVGTATAGIGHAAIIAHLLAKPMAYVRGKAKDHGRQNLIEGHIETGSRVILVEDLVSTGKSSLECIEVLQQAGIKVVGVIAIFTYGMKKSKENFKRIKIPLYTLTNLDELLETARADNYIKAEAIERIKRFRDNPDDESWLD